MKRATTILLAIMLGTLGASACTSSGGDGAVDGADSVSVMPLDRAALEQAMGRSARALDGGVLRFGMPRSDLRVTVDGVRLQPALALGSWIAFKATPHGAIAMGDMVLLDTELGPVLSRLQEAGIEQSAIHHHLIRESPRVLYAHVHAHGDPTRIAAGVRAALELTATPPASPTSTPAGTADATSTGASGPNDDFELDTMAINSALGFNGTVNGGVFQISVPRAETVRDAGIEIPPTMGLSTALNFQPTGAGRAAITGDFVLLASEVNPVIRVLRSNGIEVTSLHNHLLADEPRFFFMHFWSNDDAVTLARALRVALDSTNSRRPLTTK